MLNITPDKIINIITELNNNNHEAYLIGGCVRDYLLHLTPSDFDIVTSATPDEICKIFPNTATVGNNFLVTLVGDVEVATYRKDRNDHAEVSHTLKEDVERRDFTINSIAYDIRNNRCIDLNNGMEDLICDKVLRFIGNPELRIIEDPVRILRGIRFASQFNLNIEDETFYAMARHKELLNTIPRERICAEIKKAFSKPCAYKFLTILKELGMFRYIFPSILELEGIDGGKHHRETVFEHSLCAVKAIDNSSNWKLKLSVLYHDCGKKYFEIEDGNYTFKNHHNAGLCDLGIDLLHGLKLSNSDFIYIRTLVASHMDSIDSSKSIKKLCAKLYSADINIKDFIRLRYADKKANMARDNVLFSKARNNYKRCLKILNEKPPFCVKDLEISGRDVIEVLNIKAGPRIGAILKQIFQMVLNEEIDNKRDILLEYLLTIDNK